MLSSALLIDYYHVRTIAAPLTMSFLNKLRPGSGEKPTPDTESAPVNTDLEIQPAPENNAAATTGPRVDSSTTDIDMQKEAMPTEHAQRGVQKIEAITLTWTRTSLIALLGLYV